MSKRALLYARVSGDDRHREDRNLLGQLAMCREYAVARDYEIVAELHEDDRGASGAAFELPQLNRVRELSQAGAFDVLVTRELDRLSRSLAKQLFVEEELRRFGVSIEYVLGDYPDTPEGNLMKNIRAAVAEFERLKITERMVRGRELKLKGGQVVAAGYPPYGYQFATVDGRATLAIDEAEAEVVRQIYEWYLDGDEHGEPLSMFAIQKKLAQLRIPSYADNRGNDGRKKRGYGEWGRGPIGKILSSETYAGVWKFRKTETMPDGKRRRRDEDELITVSVPAIISRATWERAQVRRAHNKETSRRNLKHDYLLRQRATCGLCGAKIQGLGIQNKSKAKYHFYYLCPAARDHVYNNYARRCALPRFRLDRVETEVWHWVLSLMTGTQALSAGLRHWEDDRERVIGPLRARLATVEASLNHHKQQLTRVLDLFLAGQFPQDLLEPRRAQIAETIESLEREQAGLQQQLSEQPLSEEYLADLRAFTAEVLPALINADEDFEFRRFVIETLNVTVTLTVEEGEQVVYVRCVLGDQRLLVVSCTTHRRSWLCRPRPSPRPAGWAGAR